MPSILPVPSSRDGDGASEPDASLTPVVPVEIRDFLTSYRPSDVLPPVRMQIAAEAVELVIRAGSPTRLRVEKDIQCLGHVVAHLVDRGRPVTLEEALEDRTILSYDLHLQKRSVATRTQENPRGILRRLQSVHRGLPWRRPRRTDGERITAMVQPTVLDQMLRIEALTRAEASRDVHGSERDGPARFLEAVSASRTARAGGTAQVSASDWAAAQRFAQRHGLTLTKATLDAALTYEVLRQAEPAMVLIARHHLSRRDLDLALACMKGLPRIPSATHRDLQRGAARVR